MKNKPESLSHENFNMEEDRVENIENQQSDNIFNSNLEPKNEKNEYYATQGQTEVLNEAYEVRGGEIPCTTFNLFVGKIQDGIATLLSEDFNLIEIPLNALPNDIRKGNILKFTIERNVREEERRRDEIIFLQKILLEDERLFLKGPSSK